jgi:DNA-binding transcriptional MocR family regulator
MLAAMERYFPEGVVWTRPSGGLFLWATLPEWMDASELLETAIEHKVAFVPGSAFQPDAASGTGKNTCRLNFSNANPEMITEGIKRLGKVITIAIDKHHAAKPVTAD